MSSSPHSRRSQSQQENELNTSSELAVMPPTSPVNQDAALLATSDPIAAPQTPANISEIDLSSPLFYGTPSSSARTPGGSALTPGRTPRGAQTPVSVWFVYVKWATVVHICFSDTDFFHACISLNLLKTH